MAGPFADARILVVGAHTSAAQFFLRRFPTPGEYLVAERYRLAADGGKGSNQAMAAARLGGRVTFVGAFGADEAGHAASAAMRQEGIDLTHLLISEQNPTGAGVGFYLEDGSLVGATHLGANSELTPGYFEAHPEIFAGEYDVLLASLEPPIAGILAALDDGRAAGIPRIILNPAPADDLPRRPLPGVDLVTPNEPEARLIAGFPPDGDDPIPLVASAVAATLAVPLVIVTMGSEGCYVHGGGIDAVVPCPRVPAVDPSGAGDCFNSALSLALAADWPLPRAIQFALSAASCSVTQPDSWPAFPTYDQAMALMRDSGEAR